MCFDFLFGGDDDNGAAAAAQSEQQRQASIEQTIAALNSVFDDPSRASQIAGIGSNVEALNLRELENQQTDAARNLKFALARSGLSGGSADVDLSADLQERADQGVLRAAQIADEAEARVRAEDEAARSHLISQAQGGLSQGSATNLALQSARDNISRGLESTQLASLGDVFAGLADALTAQQIASGRIRARSRFTEDDRFKSLSPGSGGSGTVTAIG